MEMGVEIDLEMKTNTKTETETETQSLPEARKMEGDEVAAGAEVRVGGRTGAATTKAARSGKAEVIVGSLGGAVRMAMPRRTGKTQRRRKMTNQNHTAAGRRRDGLVAAMTKTPGGRRIATTKKHHSRKTTTSLGARCKSNPRSSLRRHSLRPHHLCAQSPR